MAVTDNDDRVVIRATRASAPLVEVVDAVTLIVFFFCSLGSGFQAFRLRRMKQ